MQHHSVRRGPSRRWQMRWTPSGWFLPAALVVLLAMTGVARAADPVAPVNPQAEIANALKPGQPASQRLGAAVLIGELAATANWETPAAYSLNEYAQPLAKMAKDDPDADI